MTSPAATILIVDDEIQNRKLLEILLQHEGYLTLSAANGEEALALIAQRVPDLILLDIMMPGMVGYQVASILKANPATSNIPIIMLTAEIDRSARLIALNAGAEEFLTKPFDGAELQLRVRNLLRLKEYGDFLQNHSRILEQRSSEVGLANRFLDSIIENIPHMIFVKDAEELRYVRVNRAVEELMGCTKAELLGKSNHDFFPPEEANFFMAKDRETLAGATNVGIDEAVRTRTHGVRMLHTKKMTIHDELNRPRYLLGISEDITEKKEREREILRLNAELEKRTAEADAASMAKSDFLATMSHEIRTPMNGMLGMLELLSLTVLDPEQRATLDVVRDSSHSLLRIVDDILDFSKIEAGKMEICPEASSVKQILRTVMGKYGVAASDKGLKIGYGIDPRINPALLVDPLRLGQILGNFVSNSVKFTERGSIEIKAEWLGAGDGAEQIRFLVTDTGSGISAENQQRLFQPFSQGQPARVAGGTGLGLTICRRLTGMMGGSVQMVSEPGKGTCMVLTLSLPVAPLSEITMRRVATVSGHDARRARVRRKPPSVAQAESEGTLALLVDDHPTNRLLLTRQLNALGYAAESVEDGVRALEQWRSGRFGIVITDCEMPNMDGYELARNIRRLESIHSSKSRRVPIIACTAHAMMGEFEKCTAAGMDDCLVKPIDLAGLLQKLEDWLPIPDDLATVTEPGELEPMPDHDPGPVDLSMIRSTWGNETDTVRAILESFRHANDEDAIRLRAAVAASDMVSVIRSAHRMLGASKIIGAQALAEVYERIAFSSRKGDWTVVHAHMQEFEQEMSRVNAYIGAFGQ